MSYEILIQQGFWMHLSKEAISNPLCFTTSPEEPFVLVNAPIQKVAPAFVQLKQATVWQQDVYDREIEILRKDFIVFQFQGHSCTLIHHLRS
jgi:hypothetical protein